MLERLKMGASRNPWLRFSDRVADYVRYRPSYPPGVVALLGRECALGPDCAIADVGSGTGLLSRLLLDAGARVFGIEPNAAMRAAGERFLAGRERFTSVDGSAEATGLQPESVDLVTAGQAFHWFDRRATRAEFARILRPPGWTALIWNERRKATTPFLSGYERLLLRWGTDYRQVDHSRIGAADLEPFFAPGTMTETRFDYRQELDFAGLRGRLLSSSYAPAAGTSAHEPMLADLRELFEEHQENGRVSLDYDTRVFWGRLRRADRDAG